MDINRDLIKKTPEEIIKALQGRFLDDLLNDLPFIRDKGVILLHGSVARGDTVASSDIDLLLILPQSVKLRNVERYFSKKMELDKQGVISLMTPFAAEEIEAEDVWQNDRLLSMLHESLSVYDPADRFAGWQKKFRHWPKVIAREKLLAAGWEFIRIRQELRGYQERGNDLEVIGSRYRLSRLLMKILFFRARKFFNEKHLSQQAKQDKDLAPYAGRLLKLVKKIGDSSFDVGLDRLLDQLEQDLVKEKLVPCSFFSSWEKWMREGHTFKVSAWD